jgi:hypothetical protein
MASSAGPALVFGASGEQGRAVLEGLLDHGIHSPIYGFTSHTDNKEDTQYLTDALGCILLKGDISNPNDVRNALTSTNATAIFLVTTTDFATADVGFATAQETEYDTIMQFFTILKEVHGQDGLPRTVLFSTRDNVQEMCRQEFNRTGEEWIMPLDDGSIVPHYSGKKGQKTYLLCSVDLRCNSVFVSHAVLCFFFVTYVPYDITSQGQSCRSSLENARRCRRVDIDQYRHALLLFQFSGLFCSSAK